LVLAFKFEIVYWSVLFRNSISIIGLFSVLHSGLILFFVTTDFLVKHPQVLFTGGNAPARKGTLNCTSRNKKLQITSINPNSNHFASHNRLLQFSGQALET